MNQPLPTCLSDFKTQFDELCGDADKIIEKYKTTDMKTTKQHPIEIFSFMTELGFRPYNGREGIYWHRYFGYGCEFDLTASGTDKDSILFHVFNRAVEFGQNDKLKEIQKILGIK